MAAVLVTTIKRFLGTAVEMAALNVAKVPAGSTFFQTDTGLLYNLDSAGFWAVKKTQLAALPAGTAVIGKVSIDQTTPGTTNKVVAELSGSILTQDPETGVKTVTSTAAELFSGTSALAGRDKLIIYNEGANNVYWGKGIVTPQTGFPLLPGDSIVFSLDPNQDIPVYFVAETDVVVRVGEMA